ncbi:MAG: hypothetical protein AAF804_15265 [Bacteroidota bacterium]
MKWKVLGIFLLSSIWGRLWSQSEVCYPQGQYFFGLNDFRPAFDPVVQRGDPVNLGYRLGFRAGYYLMDGLALGAGLTRSVEPIDLPLHVDVYSYTIFHLTLRFYWIPYWKVSPLIEGGYAFAGTDQDVPIFGFGAGSSFWVRLGLSYRLNHAWSMDIGYAVHRAIGNTFLRPFRFYSNQRIIGVPKWSLIYHW